jgi:enoyl-CoA hydratase/carnithine racemase
VSIDGGDHPLVVTERRGDVCVLRLHREEKLNALSGALEDALARALESPPAASAGAVVLYGGARAFSAGADTTELASGDVAAVDRYYRTTGRVYEQVANLGQPSVAAIAGWCLGGGLELALATDLRVAAVDARFGLPEVGIGIVPSSGGIARLVRMVGVARARELVLWRSRWSATEALGMGLVSEVVEPPGLVLERAVEIAGELARLPRLAQRVARRSIDAAAESSHRSVLLLEELAYGYLGAARPSTESPDHGAGDEPGVSPPRP